MGQVNWQRPSTKHEAYVIYKRYKDLNQDLDPDLLEQMAVFAVARRTTKKALCELFDYPFNSTPYYHTAWYYWKAFESSGLEEHWKRFVTERNKNGDTGKCTIQLEKRLGKSSPLISTLKRRLMLTSGTLAHNLDSPRRKKLSVSPQSLWTKGGAWSSSCPMTKILLLKQHLPLRNWNRIYQASLAQVPKVLCSLETELSVVFDPNTEIASELKTRAVQYVIKRLPDLIGWRTRNSSIWSASWFFQRPLPNKDRYWYDWRTQQHRARRDSSKFNDFIWW